MYPDKDKDRSRGHSAASLYFARIPWLCLMLVTSSVTSSIIASFEAALASHLVLTAFIPMLMDSAGNAGGQASAAAVRDIAKGRCELLSQRIAGELRVGILCGVTLGALSFVKLMTLDSYLMGREIDLDVAFSVSAALTVTVVVAKLIGGVLPYLAKYLSLDPAAVSSPIVTTTVDALALVIYFSLARMLV